MSLQDEKKILFENSQLKCCDWLTVFRRFFMISKRDCLNILQSDGNWWEYYAQAILVKKIDQGIVLD